MGFRPFMQKSGTQGGWTFYCLAIGLPTAVGTFLALSSCKPRNGAFQSVLQSDEADAQVDQDMPLFVASSKLGDMDDPKKTKDYCGKFDARVKDRGKLKEILAQRDEMYQIMALAVVFKDWQDGPGSQTVRGHNIGGVLVDQDWLPVWWERNANHATCNGTQHGETRMLWSFLNFSQIRDLKCHQVFTSLEPCAMCSGMMTQQQIRRTVYGNTDFGFGKAIQRLHESPPDSIFMGGRATRSSWGKKSKIAFPRTPTSVQSSSLFRIALDEELFAYEKLGGLTVDFLASNAGSDDPSKSGTKCASTTAQQRGDSKDVGCARMIFEKAAEAFKDYPNYIANRTHPITGASVPVLKDESRGVVIPNELLPDNVAIYKAALEFYDNDVTDFYVNLEDHIEAARIARDQNSTVVSVLDPKNGRKKLGKIESCAINPGDPNPVLR